MGGIGRSGLAAAAMMLLAACQTPHNNSVALAPMAQLTAPARPTLPMSSAMPAGTPTANIPAAYVSFCSRYPGECSFSPDQPEIVQLTDETWAALKSANDRVNAAVAMMDDVSHFGRIEYWTLPTDGSGDCEDYALAKRKELIAAGFPARALRVAIVVTMRDFRHAVLTVTTDRGDYVLDNATSEILPWRQAGYLWLARQDPSRALGWVTP